MEAFLSQLLEWVQQHPHWAGAAVLTISALESLLVVGLFVPGTVVMFGFGALVAAGAMELLPTLAWAVTGAVAGDGISFFIGRHFHQRLRVVWPFRTHPKLMARGVDFFHHHGGKSVVFARFVGPVRPIVPAVAGMLNMAPGRFFMVNALSALLWAPAYLLPGLVFGASLGLAAEVAGRLALLLGLLIAIVWFCVWAVQRLFRLFQPQAAAMLGRSLDWSRSHPVIRPLAGALLDPAHPEARGLTILMGLLLVASWLFLITLQQVLDESLLANLDRLVFHSLQGLRTPWADQIMVTVTQWGDGFLLASLSLGLALWLALSGYWRACLHWLAAFLCAALLTRAVKLSTQVERPMELYSGADAFSFPSSHVSLSVVVYGFLAVMLARELPLVRRWLPYTLATLICVPIGFSRLYLGAHWLSDVVGGLSLGLFWLALMGIAYRRHPGPTIPVRRASLLAVAILLLAGGWNLQQHLHQDLQRYQPQREHMHWSLAQWQGQTWNALPAYRLDLEGKHRHPLNLQWLGSVRDIDAWLMTQGWQTPPATDLRQLLPSFSANPDVAQLPVLPQVHDGRHERLLRVYQAADQDYLMVLRLWSADTDIGDPPQPLWIGNVTLLQRRSPLGLFTLLRTATDFTTPFAHFRAQLDEWPGQQQLQTGTPYQTLLLWSDAPSMERR